MNLTTKIGAEKPDLVSIILQIILAIIVMHISLLCLTDILDCEFDVKLNYPAIIEQLLWGIFLLPFVGFSLLFVKNYYWKTLGAFALIVSVWEIWSFLQRISGSI